MEYVQHLLLRLFWVLVIMLAVENGCNGCWEKERIALLQLKDSINFPNGTSLPSWEEDYLDCCQWERVTCNSSTRRVIKLSLNATTDWYNQFEYGIPSNQVSLITWYLNASILLPFEYLQSLDLSRNGLQGFHGNEGIGTLSNLSNFEELDLSWNALGNSILPSLNNLSNLKILNLAGTGLDGSISINEFDGLNNLKKLDLSENRLRSIITVNGIGTLSNLSNLEELDLSYNIALGNSILPSLNKLSNLKILNLAGNRLNGSISINEFDGLNNLKKLDLSWNNLCIITLNGIGTLSNLSNLEELDLSSNAFGNSILPSLNKLSNLKILNLAGNSLNGSISINGIGTLSNLSNLEELDLSLNALGNSILPSLNKLSNLKILNLVETGLNGSISINEFDGLNNLKELDLSYNRLRSIITVNGSQEESGILNELEVLDLSDNYYLNDSIWSFLKELSSIKTLDLSWNHGLLGAIHNLTKLSSIENLFMDRVILDNDFLPNIRVMTSIQVLSLRDSTVIRILPITGLCELKTLRELDITRTGFGGSLPWCLVNLTSLRLLDITSNHFNGNIARSPLINLTSLEYLAISNNDFEIPISFKSFFNHSKLEVIESLNNKLLEEEDILGTSPSFQLIGLRLSSFQQGRITKSFPHFLYNQHDLKMVELRQIGFSGKFPNWLLYNNTRMKTLLLSSNSFGGSLLLPSLPARTLLELEISKNHLEGFIPYKIASSFPSLQILNMSTNNFGGNIPSSFGDMTALTWLDLSNNRLSGEIPVHLAIGCRRLEFLKLSNNNLKGPILPHQNNLTQLYTLYSDHNGFTEIPPTLSLSPLEWLNSSANQLVGKIPGFIGNMSSLRVLAMAGNHLEGPIPVEFCQLNSLGSLDLSENYITGAIPSCFNSSNGLSIIRLSKNRLHGPFPVAFQNLSGILELDLSYNQFSGNIPPSIGSLSYLTVLLLQNNHFEGNIPKELCHLSWLTLIDLSSNNLSGNIISCISNVKFNGTPGMDFQVGGIAYSPSKFTSVLHDRLRTKGEEIEFDMFISSTYASDEIKFQTKGMSLTYKGTVLRLFSGINLSHNRLTGPIPPEIGNLSNIKVLNLSHNYLAGTIPATFSNLKSIESLDLSYNHLSGKIPSQITELYSLEVFNLSYNDLSGSIPPRVNQFGTFESNSYIGNPLLCGEPLPRKCNAAYSPPRTPSAAINGSEEDSGFMDMDTFYMSFAGSYVFVVLAIVAILFINPYLRRAWFHLIEVFLTSSYYFVVDNLVYPVRGFLWK